MTATMIEKPVTTPEAGESDVAGDLSLELAQQRIGEETAVVTGMPGLSTVHCLTVRADREFLPTM